MLHSKLLFGSSDVLLTTLLLSIFGSCIAFCLVMSEFLLVKSTSSVTMSVAGIFKEICTIVVAVLIAGERLTNLNIAGLSVSIVGIIYYNILKYKGLTTVGAGHGGDTPRASYSKLPDRDPNTS